MPLVLLSGRYFGHRQYADAKFPLDNKAILVGQKSERYLLANHYGRGNSSEGCYGIVRRADGGWKLSYLFFSGVERRA